MITFGVAYRRNGKNQSEWHYVVTREMENYQKGLVYDEYSGESKRMVRKEQRTSPRHGELAKFEYWKVVR